MAGFGALIFSRLRDARQRLTDIRFDASLLPARELRVRTRDVGSHSQGAARLAYLRHQLYPNDRSSAPTLTRTHTRTCTSLHIRPYTRCSHSHTSYTSHTSQHPTSYILHLTRRDRTCACAQASTSRAAAPALLTPRVKRQHRARRHPVRSTPRTTPQASLETIYLYGVEPKRFADCTQDRDVLSVMRRLRRPAHHRSLPSPNMAHHTLEARTLSSCRISC